MVSKALATIRQTSTELVRKSKRRDDYSSLIKKFTSSLKFESFTVYYKEGILEIAKGIKVGDVECTIFDTNESSQPIAEVMDLTKESQKPHKTNDSFKTLYGLGKSRFYSAIYLLISERAKYPAGSLMNTLYKFMANASIGAMGRGLSQKTVYDPGTGVKQVVPTGALTNPLYSAWTIAFVRTVLTEIMSFYHSKGYKVISCTTDGFIVAAPEMFPKETDFGIFSSMYQAALSNLDIDKYFLEVKHEDTGLYSWKTRGQLSETGQIRAMSGYTNYLTIPELVALVGGKMESSLGKSFTFQQRSLRSGSEVLQKGGDMTMMYSEKTYSVATDNKRLFDLQSVPGAN